AGFQSLLARKRCFECLNEYGGVVDPCMCIDGIKRGWLFYSVIGSAPGARRSLLQGSGAPVLNCLDQPVWQAFIDNGTLAAGIVQSNGGAAVIDSREQCANAAQKEGAELFGLWKGTTCYWVRSNAPFIIQLGIPMGTCKLDCTFTTYLGGPATDPAWMYNSYEGHDTSATRESGFCGGDASIELFSISTGSLNKPECNPTCSGTTVCVDGTCQECNKEENCCPPGTDVMDQACPKDPERVCKEVSGPDAGNPANTPVCGCSAGLFWCFDTCVANGTCCNEGATDAVHCGETPTTPHCDLIGPSTGPSGEGTCCKCLQNFHCSADEICDGCACKPPPSGCSACDPGESCDPDTLLCVCDPTRTHAVARALTRTSAVTFLDQLRAAHLPPCNVTCCSVGQQCPGNDKPDQICKSDGDNAVACYCPDTKYKCDGKCIAVTECCGIPSSSGPTPGCPSGTECNSTSIACECPSGAIPVAGDECIAVTECCGIPSSSCPTPGCPSGTECNSTSIACECPSGEYLCGDECIAVTECCGIPSSSGPTPGCPSGTECNSTSIACECPSGEYLCGDECIAVTECCGIPSSSGPTPGCPSGTECNSTSIACECPSGEYLCGDECIAVTECCGVPSATGPTPGCPGNLLCNNITDSLNCISVCTIGSQLRDDECCVDDDCTATKPVCLLGPNQNSCGECEDNSDCGSDEPNCNPVNNKCEDCPSGTHFCGNNCIPNGNCCDDDDCKDAQSSSRRRLQSNPKHCDLTNMTDRKCVDCDSDKECCSSGAKCTISVSHNRRLLSEDHNGVCPPDGPNCGECQPGVAYNASAAGNDQVYLGAAACFVVFGGAGITNAGNSRFLGSLGVWPLTSGSVTGIRIPSVMDVSLATGITGAFDGSAEVLGGFSVHTPNTVKSDDDAAEKAQAALTAAYLDATVRVPATESFTGAAQLGGRTLGPGVYRSDASFQIGPSTGAVDGTLTLDGGNDEHAVFIFHSVSTTIVWNFCRVVLTNGARARNVFWAVGSSGTLYGNTVFEGTMMAYANIATADGTGGSGSAVVHGRLLAHVEAVTITGALSDAIGCQILLPL
ncbi:hypothetical protein FOA52_009791, partial [Chlamydomonas sp. UWO 241]